MSTSQWSDVL